MVTTHRAALENGPVVNSVTRQVRWLSASVITVGDHTQVGGCERRWYYKYVEGRNEPSTPQQTEGVEVHRQIEEYLNTGVDKLGAIASFGRDHIPRRGVLAIEHPVRMTVGVSTPFFGHVDCIQSCSPDDPLHTVEVIDWKTTSSISKWAKPAEELADTTQMICYGEYAARNFFAEHVRLTHVYFQTRGPAKSERRSILLDRRTVAERFHRITQVANRLEQVARFDSVESTNANKHACSAYRGCPHRAYCSAGKPTLDELFGPTKKDRSTKEMSLRDQLLASIKKPAVPVVSEVKEGPLPEVQKAVDMIKAAQLGLPEVVGEAARAWSLADAGALPDPRTQGYLGSGQLGTMRLETVKDILEIAATLEAEIFEKPGDVPMVPKVSAVTEPSVLEKAQAFSELTDLPAKKRGRPKKTDEHVVTTPVLPIDTAVSTELSAYTTKVVSPDLNLFVDAVTSTPTQSLAPYIDATLKELCEKASTVDIRCCSGDSPMAFGKWKGVLAATVRANPPPLGSYSLDARGSEISECVIEALRPLCTLYVRGVR